MTLRRGRAGAGPSLQRTGFRPCHHSFPDRHHGESQSRADHRGRHPDKKQRNRRAAARRSHGGVWQVFRAALRRAHCRRQRLADGRSSVRPYILTAALNRSPRLAQRGPKSNSTGNGHPPGWSTAAQASSEPRNAAPGASAPTRNYLRMGSLPTHALLMVRKLLLAQHPWDLRPLLPE